MQLAILRLLIFLAGCLLLVPNVGFAQPTAQELHTPVGVGPTIELRDFQGNRQRLVEYTGQGKWLIVMIWAYDCHVCNVEAAGYVAFHNQHKNRDATILGISMDGWERKEDALAFIERHQVDFPNLIGSPEDVSTLYQQLSGGFLAGTPAFLVFSPSGELQAAQVGAVPPEVFSKFITQQGLERNGPK